MNKLHLKAQSSLFLKFVTVLLVCTFILNPSTQYQSKAKKDSLLSAPSAFGSLKNKIAPKIEIQEFIDTPSTLEVEKRPFNAIISQYTLLLISTLGILITINEVIIELIIFKNIPIAMFNLSLIPLGLLMTAYPISFLVYSIISFFRPTEDFLTDKKYYSFTPKAKPKKTPWPSITIQIPVYDEDFNTVIKPTLLSVIEASSHYKQQGGIANIIVNDDLLMRATHDKLLKVESKINNKLKHNKNLTAEEEEVWKRLQFYRNHDIAFTARSKENRIGRFKKAGNMNKGIQKGLFLESEVGPILIPLDKSKINTIINEQIDKEETHFYAEGDIRLGEFILLLDKDSIVPEEILSKTIPEFLLEPKLGFTQHKSVPTNENENYFSKMIGRFTLNLFQLIFVSSTNGGDPSPLIGHNAILRKEAMLEAAFKQNNKRYIWNEKRVSEDFDLAMRMQTKGYFGRYIAYPNMNFGEAVTRTYQEEIKKLSKFSFGASEMVFNPIYQWLEKGIFTDSFLDYLKSKHIKWYSKSNMILYLSSYIALSMITIKMIINVITIFLGMYLGLIATTTYGILLNIFVIFVILAPLSQMVLRLKLYSNPVFNNEIGNNFNEIKKDIRFAFMFAIFYAAVPYAFTKGFFSHLFNLKLEWNATNVDELTNESWKKTGAEILQTHKDQFLFSLILIGLLSYGLTHVFATHPLLAIVVFTYPLSHLIVPFLYNPKFINEINEAFSKGFKIPLSAKEPIEAKKIPLIITNNTPMAVSL